MRPSDPQNNGNKPLSVLQLRIKKYGSILTRYNDTFENNVQPLIQFAIILCENQNYEAADDILSHLIESDAFQGYEKLSVLWILRSEIAEELGQLQKAIKLFEKAARSQAQPYMDIMRAFQSFRQRHSHKKSNALNKASIPCMDTPVPLSNISKKRKLEPRLPRYTPRNQIGMFPSPMGSIGISPIHSNPKTPCTPLTDDFEQFMFESDRKASQRKKKFYFRSKQNKKQVNTMARLPTASHEQIHKATLSPIMDVTETDMSLSTSFIGLNISNNNENEMVPSMAPSLGINMSGLSDVSSIAPGLNMNKLSPELPPSMPSTSVPITPLNAMHAPCSPMRHDKENRNSLNRHDHKRGKGSEIRMEIIHLSPAKKNKYGSNKILSPVRRSKRIQENKEGNGGRSLQELLQDSNYTYVPNPMLNSTS
eukprot:593886_1